MDPRFHGDDNKRVGISGERQGCRQERGKQQSRGVFGRAFIKDVIPAEAGIQRKSNNWIP
jgi:hypothetical protein